MNHAGESEARSVYRTHRTLGEADAFVAAQYGREVAPVAAGDEAVAFAQFGRDVGDLETLGLAWVNRTAKRLEAFHEERADKVRLKAAGLGFFHFFLYRKQALGGETFLSQRVAVENGHQMLAVEDIVDGLIEAGADLGLVAVANGFQQHVLKAVAFKDFSEDVEDLAVQRLADDL